MKILKLLVIIFFSFTASAQSLIEKIYSYPGPMGHGAGAIDMVQTPDSGFMMAASLWDNNTGSYDSILFLKTDYNGNFLWHTKIGSFHERWDVFKIINTYDSGFVATGFGTRGRFLIRLNKDGDTLWTKNIITPINSNPFEDLIEFNSGYVITTTDGELVRADLNLDTLWTLSLGFNNTTLSIVNGEIFVASSYYGPDSIAIVKVDSGGNLKGIKQFYMPNSSNIQISAVSNGYNIFGHTNPNFAGDSCLMMNVNFNLDPLWIKKYPSHPGECISTSDGGFAFMDHDQINLQSRIIHFDSSGNIMWTQVLPGLANVISLCETSTGFIAASGQHIGSVYFARMDSLAISVKENNIHKPPILFPNPVEDYFIINAISNSDQFELKLFDISGKEVLYKYARSGDRINFEKFSSGIYIYSIKIPGDNFIFGKLVKR